MSDLAAFLTARLDEDEAVAKAATEGPWAWAATGEKDNSWAVALVGDADEEEKMLSGRIEAGDGIIIDPVCEGINGNLPDAAHIARHDPARALRRVDADRKILAEHQAVTRLADLTGQELGFLGWYREWVLKNLAAVWSDHPDYDPAWRP